jgi:hypothetical protein
MGKKARIKVGRPLDPDTMGRMGETRFGELCDSGNLIANDSRRADRMGWDYLVEFPLPHHRGDAPFDSQSKLPDMKVQVKTVWSDRSVVDIELAAARRLAIWDYPSFIVLLRLNMDLTYRDVHIIHLLDDNLARILKALRQAEAKGSLSIRNKTISFGIQDGTRITVNGQELAGSLRAAIGGDPDAYMAQKHDQLRNLGFEPHRYTGSFSITAASEDELLNVFLGLRKAQDSRFAVDEVRFGIPLAQIRETSATLEIKPESHGLCEFVMTSSVGDRRRAIFEAELYIARTTPQGPWKIRIHSPLIELLCARDASDAVFTIGVPSGAHLTLSDIVRIYRAKLIVASGPSNAFARMGGKRLFEFDIKEKPSLANLQELDSRIKLLTNFDTLLRSLNVHDIKLNEDDIASNIDSIDFVFESQRPENGISMSLKVRPKEDGPQIPDEVEGVFASAITFRGVIIAFWASMGVAARLHNDYFAVHCTDFRLRDIAVLGTDQTFDQFVDEASESSGLSLVIKTDTVSRSRRSEPAVVDDDEDGASLV